jgi:hypothetical protein
LVEEQQWKRAKEVLTEVLLPIYKIDDKEARIEATKMQFTGLVEAEQWDQAGTLLRMIKDEDVQASAKRELGIGMSEW